MLGEEAERDEEQSITSQIFHPQVFQISDLHGGVFFAGICHRLRVLLETGTMQRLRNPGISLKLQCQCYKEGRNITSPQFSLPFFTSAALVPVSTLMGDALLHQGFSHPNTL